MKRELSRRSFVTGAAASGLVGCTVSPGTPGFGAWSWAEHVDQRLADLFGYPRAKEYDATAATPDFPVRSLTLPDGYADTLAAWSLTVDGLVAKPARFTMAELQAAFVKTGAVTRHDCVEGWSAIAGWSGVRLSDLLDAVQPTEDAAYVVFHSADLDPTTGAFYYGSLRLRDARHPQTVLAYEMNGAPLPLDHGAPLRLKVPTQLGYKSTKFIHRISFVDTLEGVGGGRGGYWEDLGYEHWAGI